MELVRTFRSKKEEEIIAIVARMEVHYEIDDVFMTTRYPKHM